MADFYTATSLTTENFDDDANFAPFSIRSASFQWTASASGTGEYYLEAAGGGTPGLSKPDAVYAGGTALTAGTAGTLTASQWDWADNDTLGFSTIYVRLSDDTDPDTKVTDFVTYTDLPAANDNLFFQFDSTQALAGSDQTAIEYDDIHVLATCSGNAGSAGDYLKLDQGTTNSVYFAGAGTWYLDMGTSGSSLLRVDRTRSASNGEAGLYVKSNTNPIQLMEVNGGTVRLTDAGVTTLVVRNNATVYIDPSCVVVTIICDGGTVIDYGAAVTTWNHTRGTGTKYGSDAFTVNVRGGVFYNDGSGTATATIYGGLFESSRDTQSKSVTLTLNGGQARIGGNVTLTGTFNTTTTMTA